MRQKMDKWKLDVIEHLQLAVGLLEEHGGSTELTVELRDIQLHMFVLMDNDLLLNSRGVRLG